MKSFRLMALASLAALLAALSMSHVRADEWDKATLVTVNEPVQIPGTVLQPGTYTFTLFKSDSDRHIVQVFNQDRTHLITTVMAIPDYQIQPAGKTILEFSERPTGQPMALRAWFYPGDNFGQEFVYPKVEATQLSQANGVTVPALSDEDSSKINNSQNTTMPAAQPASGPQNNTASEPVAQEPATTQDQSQAPTSGTMPNQQPTNKQLPKTASDLPLVGLIGLMSLAGAITLRRLSRRQPS